MADPMMGAEDPNAAPDPAAAPDGEGMGAGYCIEIHVSAEGSIKIGVEPEGDEAAEEGAATPEAGAEEGDDAQPVANIREAMKVVMDIYKNSGQIADADGEDQMSAGYK